MKEVYSFSWKIWADKPEFGQILEMSSNLEDLLRTLRSSSMILVKEFVRCTAIEWSVSKPAMASLEIYRNSKGGNRFAYIICSRCRRKVKKLGHPEQKVKATTAVILGEWTPHFAVVSSGEVKIVVMGHFDQVRRGHAAPPPPPRASATALGTSFDRIKATDSETGHADSVQRKCRYQAGL